MNLITMVLSISCIILILHKAVRFSSDTACRQEAWLKSIELLSYQKMSKENKTILFHKNCQFRVQMNKTVSWREIKNSNSHQLNFSLLGNL
jgi:hypothetical protein